VWNARIQARILEKKDTRMKYTSEGINNIKAVKLNDLFSYFISKIQSARNEEVQQTKLKYCSGAMEDFS
jgi:hypothetical protein